MKAIVTSGAMPHFFSVLSDALYQLRFSSKISQILEVLDGGDTAQLVIKRKNIKKRLIFIVF
jgi:hypothetical protein